MRSLIVCFPVFFILFFMASGLLAQQTIDYSPVSLPEQSIGPFFSEEPIPPSSKVYTVPRKQVLLEIGTRTS